MDHARRHLASYRDKFESVISERSQDLETEIQGCFIELDNLKGYGVPQIREALEVFKEVTAMQERCKSLEKEWKENQEQHKIFKVELPDRGDLAEVRGTRILIIAYAMKLSDFQIVADPKPPCVAI